MMKPFAFEGAERLPGAIVDLLAHLIRRARCLIVLRGLGASGTAALGTFLTVMLIDANTAIAAAWGRWLLAGLAYLSVAATLFWFLVRPLARSFTLTGVARLLEQKHPELHERISSAVELLTSRDLPDLRGSEVLIQELAREAVMDVGTIRPKEELSWRLAIPFLVSAGILAAIMGGLLLIRPRETMVLLARATAPFLNLSNAKALTLVVTPGDTIIAAGTPLTIQVETSDKRVEAAHVRQTDKRGHMTKMPMAPVAGGTNGHARAFTLTLPDVVQDFRYQVQAGNALTRQYAVRVAVAPVIEHQDVACVYPTYARLPEWRERDGAGTIRALAGTAVTITATVNKPVPTAELLVRSQSQTNAFTGTLRTAANTAAYDFAFVLPPGVDGRWTIRLRDEIGLENKPFENTIQTLPDQPPAVRITNLERREFRLNRTDRLPVRYAAEDDLGLTLVDLITVISGDTNAYSTRLAGPTNEAHVLRAIEGGLEIDLSSSRYAQAPRLEFHLLALDSLPAGQRGPQAGRTETVTILLEDAAPSWKEQVLDSQEARIRAGLAELGKQLKDAEEKSAALAAPLAKPGPLPDQAITQTGALQDTLAAADTNLRRLTSEIADGFFEALATNLSAVADAHIAPAERLAGEMRLVDTPEERTGINSNVTANVQEARSAVNALAQQFERTQEALQRAVALEQMAQQQERLALEKQALEQAAQAAATNAPTAEAVAAEKAWDQEQARLAAELAKLALQAEGAAQEVATLVSNQSASAASDARELAERQAENADWMRDAAADAERLSRERAALATKQQQLATEAEKDSQAKAQSPAMQAAAEHLRTDAMEAAQREQAATEAALRKEASVLRKEADAAVAALAQARPPTERADEAAKRGEAAALEARQAARQAKRDAAGIKDSAGANKDEKQVAATDAWAKAAEQAAEQATQAYKDAKQAAEEARNTSLAEPARETAADRADQAADRAERHAEEAQAYQQQAATEARQDASPEKQAVQAAQQAAEAAARAQAHALTASAAAAEAEREANTREQKAEATAPEARQRAEKAGAAADTARQAQETATKAAEDAREAAARALDAETPKAGAAAAKEAQAQAKRADAAAQEAQAAAQQALEAAGKQPEESAISPPAQPPADPAAAAGQAGKQAEAAQKMAQQADAAAKQAAQQASATQQREQAKSATAQQLAQQAEAAAKQAEQAAEQAGTQAKQAQDAAQQATGKPEARQAEQAAQTAQQNADQAQRQAQQAQQQAQTAKQAAEATAQSAQQTAQAAAQAQQAAQQTAQHAQAAQTQAQQAAKAAQQAGAAATPQAKEQAQQQAESAAQRALDEAAAAVEAARQAEQAATGARQATEATALEDLANRQADIRRQTETLMKAENSGRAETLDALAEQVGEMQQSLATEADALAQDLSDSQAQAASPAAQVAAQARTAAGEWQQDDRKPARAAARQAQTGLDQLADTLAETARSGAADPTVPPAERVERAQQAQQAAAMAERQSALAEQMNAIADGQLMQALANQQAMLGADTEALNEQAAVLNEQATAMRTALPAMAAPAALAAQSAARADQMSGLADSAAQQAAERAGEAPMPGALPPDAQAAGSAKTATQHQEAAAQSLAQAAQNLAALSAGAPAPQAPGTDPAPGLASMAAAHEAALQAAASSESLAAAKASAQMAQAANEAASAAAAQGANPQPPDLRMASGGEGGSKNFNESAEAEVGAFVNRFDPRLRDWLRLHGELEHDVLQAQGTEGPEEYRTIIKRYFHEVTRRGNEEKEP